MNQQNTLTKNTWTKITHPTVHRYRASGGVNEGGIRTPTFLTGGYIENMLEELETPTSLCEYNSMVHIRYTGTQI